jgi:hypothetical protein
LSKNSKIRLRKNSQILIGLFDYIKQKIETNKPAEPNAEEKLKKIFSTLLNGNKKKSMRAQPNTLPSQTFNIQVPVNGTITIKKFLNWLKRTEIITYDFPTVKLLNEVLEKNGFFAEKNRYICCVCFKFYYVFY